MTLSARYRMHLPERFLQKEVNERVVCELLCRALCIGEARRGDPALREPDLFLDGRGEEVTLATEGKHNPSFLGKYCDGEYRLDEAQNAMTLPILAALERKSRKSYVGRPVAVAVLCMLELFDWTEDTFGRLLAGQPLRERDAFFSIVRELYIERGIFSEVHLLVPTLSRGWVVFALAEKKQFLVPLADEADKFPYFEKNG